MGDKFQYELGATIDYENNTVRVEDWKSSEAYDWISYNNKTDSFQIVFDPPIEIEPNDFTITLTLADDHARTPMSTVVTLQV